MNFLSFLLEKLLVTTSGLNHIADQLRASAQAAMSHMAIGTGTTGEVAGDTTLETEIARVALDSIGGSGAQVDYTATLPAGTGTGAITEMGLFNAAAAGDMLERETFAVKNKGVNDTLVLTKQHTYDVAA